MMKIRPTVDEKLVLKVMLYGKSNDTYVYSDEACKTKVTKDVLLNLCLKGLAIVTYGDIVCNPVCFKDATTHAEVTLLNASATAITLNSEEYTA